MNRFFDNISDASSTSNGWATSQSTYSARNISWARDEEASWRFGTDAEGFPTVDTDEEDPDIGGDDEEDTSDDGSHSRVLPFENTRSHPGEDDLYSDANDGQSSMIEGLSISPIQYVDELDRLHDEGLSTPWSNSDWASSFYGAGAHASSVFSLPTRSGRGDTDSFVSRSDAGRYPSQSEGPEATHHVDAIDTGSPTPERGTTEPARSSKQFMYECPLCFEKKETLSSVPCGHVFCTTYGFPPLLSCTRIRFYANCVPFADASGAHFAQIDDVHCAGRRLSLEI